MFSSLLYDYGYNICYAWYCKFALYSINMLYLMYLNRYYHKCSSPLRASLISLKEISLGFHPWYHYFDYLFKKVMRLSAVGLMGSGTNRSLTAQVSESDKICLKTCIFFIQVFSKLFR